jgi:methylmalonyl-CoA mutase
MPDQFRSITPEEWKQKIIADLKGKEYERLIRHAADGIDVLPFYTKEDGEKYRLAISPKKSARWLITEKVFVDEHANRHALSALQMGAEAILFDFKQQPFDANSVKALLAGIQTDIAPVYFQHFTDETRQYLPEGFMGKIEIAYRESYVEQLHEALSKGVLQAQAVFHFSIGSNYFFEIAKLRAFRWLWKQVCRLQQRTHDVFIFAETQPDYNDPDVYTNLLRNTTQAMSAVLGGCDALIVQAHTEIAGEHSFASRMARNIQHILQQESGFHEIRDAVSGAYYIEYLTCQFARKAWERFRADAA